VCGTLAHFAKLILTLRPAARLVLQTALLRFSREVIAGTCDLTDSLKYATIKAREGPKRSRVSLRRRDKMLLRPAIRELKVLHHREVRLLTVNEPDPERGVNRLQVLHKRARARIHNDLAATGLNELI